MTTRTASSKEEHLNQALEVVVETQWQVWLHVVEKGSVDGDEDSEERYSHLLPNDSTVHQVKQLIHEKRGYRAQDQRWSDTEGNPVLCGPVFRQHEGESETAIRTRTLNLQIVPTEARLEASFSMLSLESVQERDKMTHGLTVSRNPRQCPGGHDLEPCETPEVAYFRQCAKCYFVPHPNSWVTHGNIKLKLLTCVQCDEPFSLCTECLANDNDRPAYADPYDELVRLLTDLARQRAGFAALFGGPGHDEGLPPITWQNEYGPKAYQKFTHFRSSRDDRERIDFRTRVVHAGARLVVRPSEVLRSILVEENLAGEAMQVDRICEHGARVHEVIEYRHIPRDIWPFVNTYYQNLHPDYINLVGDPANIQVWMRLIFMSVEEVVYEVDATISDAGDY